MSCHHPICHNGAELTVEAFQDGETLGVMQPKIVLCPNCFANFVYLVHGPNLRFADATSGQA